MRSNFFEIDPRKLFYFAEIVDHGSFNKAARVLGISQPALSGSMDALEEEIGQPLLIRGREGSHTTHVGDVVYRHAQFMRDEMMLMRNDLRAEMQSPEDTVLLGCLPSLSGSVVPDAINAWRKPFPLQNLRVFEKVQIDLLASLLRREISIAIGVTDYYDLLDGLRQRVLFREKLAIVARANHPLASSPNLRLEDFVNFPWVTPPAGRHATFLDELFATDGLEMSEQAIVCSSSSLLRALVANSDHLALLPAHAIKNNIAAEGLVLLPFDSPALERNIALFFREHYSLSNAEQFLVKQIEDRGSVLYQN